MPAHPTDICYLPAAELLSLFRRKALSPVEAAGAVLDRIAEVDGAVNAFILVDGDSALAQARASEARWMKGEPLGLLDGAPATIKDLVLTKGWPTLKGSRTTDPNQAWEEDAPVTARLREAGAVLIGKTTTPEFGWKGVTDSPLSGVTRNPWNTGMTPGGSSGGAAAAAALGMGALHQGSDGGGSIRIPSGFTGVFGHKPSFGRVPFYPPTPNGSLVHIGPITRTVADAALMLTVIARPDPRDWYALPYEGRDYRVGLEEGVAGLRVGFSPALGYAKVDPEVAESVRAAADVLAGLGAEVEEADPGFADPAPFFKDIWYANCAFLCRDFTQEQLDLLDPNLRKVVEEGAAVSAFDLLRATTGERVELGLCMKRFHERYDLLLTPTLAVPAFPAGRLSPGGGDEEGWMGWTPFSFPFNLSRQPACTVPCGFTKAGLPVGMQIVGPMHDDALVLRAARAFESARPFRMPEGPKS